MVTYWRLRQSLFWTRCELTFGVLLVAVVTAALCEAPRAGSNSRRPHLSQAEAVAAFLDEADVDLAVPGGFANEGGQQQPYYGYYLTDGKRSRRPVSWGKVTPGPVRGEAERKQKAGLVWNEILEQYDVSMSNRFPTSDSISSPSSGEHQQQRQATSFASTTPPPPGQQQQAPRDGQSSFPTQIKEFQPSAADVSSTGDSPAARDSGSSQSLNVSSEAGRGRGREKEEREGPREEDGPAAGVDHFVRVSRQLAGNNMFVHRSRQYDVPQIGKSRSYTSGCSNVYI